MDQTPAHDLHNDTILAILNTLRPESVVEFGCMRGSLAKKYRETVPDSLWYGIDIDEDNVHQARVIPNGFAGRVLPPKRCEEELCAKP